MLLSDRYRVFTATDAEQGLRVLKQQDVKAIISDYSLPGMNGLDFLCHARECSPAAGRILMTGYNIDNISPAAIQDGSVNHIVHKPWKNVELLQTLGQACSS